MMLATVGSTFPVYPVVSGVTLLTEVENLLKNYATAYTCPQAAGRCLFVLDKALARRNPAAMQFALK